MGKESQEVSLLDIWRVVVQQKQVIFLIWILCVALGATYVMLATPVYKAEVFMLPPSSEDIQPLNISAFAALANSSSMAYDTESVYGLYVQMLKSRSIRRSFFEEHQVAMKLGFSEGDDPDIFFESHFNQKLNVVQNIKKKEGKAFVTLSFETRDPNLASVIANQFADKVAHAAVERLVNEVNSRITSVKTGIEESILGKKALAKIRRADRITALLEAVSISRALGDQNRQLNPSELAINTEEFPLYLINEAVLKAEIKVLKARKDDAPFIEGLRDLEEAVAALEQISIAPSMVKAVFVDQKAWEPSSPMGPKKTLMLLLFGLSGLLLGIVVAIFRKQTLGLHN